MRLEFVSDCVPIDVSAVSHTVTRAGIIFCKTAGNVSVTWPSGVTTLKALTVGEYWRVCPKTINTGATTATVEMHTY